MFNDVLGFNPFSKDNNAYANGYTNTMDKTQALYGYIGKAYGDPIPVMPVDEDDALQSLPNEDINLDGSQTKLLKTVIEYLNQASTALYFSNNRFLASAAKDLASQLSDKFCIG